MMSKLSKRHTGDIRVAGGFFAARGYPKAIVQPAYIERLPEERLYGRSGSRQPLVRSSFTARCYSRFAQIRADSCRFVQIL